MRGFKLRKGSSGWFVNGLHHGAHMESVGDEEFKHITNYRMGHMDGRVKYPIDGTVWNLKSGIYHGHGKAKIAIDTVRGLRTQNNESYFGINYNRPWQE